MKNGASQKSMTQTGMKLWNWPTVSVAIGFIKEYDGREPRLDKSTTLNTTTALIRTSLSSFLPRYSMNSRFQGDLLCASATEMKRDVGFQRLE